MTQSEQTNLLNGWTARGEKCTDYVEQLVLSRRLDAIEAQLAEGREGKITIRYDDEAPKPATANATIEQLRKAAIVGVSEWPNSVNPSLQQARKQFINDGMLDGAFLALCGPARSEAEIRIEA